MIFKDRNPAEHTDIDRFSQAGAEAEEQMAFYLRRAFLQHEDILVFNDLRLRDDTGDCAQFDHLVLHRHGFIIVESKSVTSQVRINRHGEWARIWDGRPQGMPSPIEQAKRQGVFLRRALNANCEALVGKVLGFRQMRFGNCPIEVLVAISDKGTIQREIEAPEVVKADQVPDRIRAIFTRHSKASNPLSLSLDFKSTDGIYKFKDEEMQQMSAFLLEHHYPLTGNTGQRPMQPPSETASSERPPAPPAPAASAPAPEATSGLGICSKCGAQCEILWGKYSYYWKCRSCDNNMSIKEFCPTCRERKKLRKDRNRFYIYCERCRTEALYCEFVVE